jgi:hypothetical protein
MPRTPCGPCEDTTERAHLIEELRSLRYLPEEIDMPSEGVAQEDVARAFAYDLVGDIRISDGHVVGLGRLHDSDSVL